MRKYTQQFLDSIFNNITVEWIMDNPVAAENLIKDLITEVVKGWSDTDMSCSLSDDYTYERELKEVDKWFKENMKYNYKNL